MWKTFSEECVNKPHLCLAANLAPLGCPHIASSGATVVVLLPPLSSFFVFRTYLSFPVSLRLFYSVQNLPFPHHLFFMRTRQFTVQK